MGKKITESSLQEALQSQKSTFLLEIGEWDVEVDNEFSNTGIHSATLNIVKAVDSMKNFDITDEVMAPFVYISILKEFTSLRDVIPNDVVGQGKVIRTLIDLDLFLPIIQALPVEEVEKVTNQVKIATENIIKTTDRFEEIKSTLDIKNKELLG